MRPAAHHPRRLGGRAPDSYGLRRLVAFLSPGTGSPTGVEIHVACRRADHAQYRAVLADQGDIHGKFTVALDELLGAIQRVDQPELVPAAALLEGYRGRFLGPDRNIGRQLVQLGEDELVGRAVGRSQRRTVVLGLDGEVFPLVDFHDGVAGRAGDTQHVVEQLRDVCSHNMVR